MNRLWLVCHAHQSKSQSFCIATRQSEGYFGAPRPQGLDDWFEKHKDCCGNKDHFSLSYEHMQDWKSEAFEGLAESVN